MKIITKFQSKQSVMKSQVSMQKIDTVHTIVADDTGTIKLILREQLIDSLPGLSISFKVASSFWKVGVSRRREPPRAVWGHAPQKILKFRCSEMLFSTFS